MQRQSEDGENKFAPSRVFAGIQSMYSFHFGMNDMWIRYLGSSNFISSSGYGFTCVRNNKYMDTGNCPSP